VRPGYLALFGGLLAVSTSAPFFVMAKLDAYAAVFHRTLFSGLCALCIAWLRGALDLKAVAQHARSLSLGGALMGAHFLLWIKAFELTDYASNLLLLVAQPVIATLLGLYLGERTTGRAWLSIGISAFGMLLIAGADLALGPTALLGDALSVIAGGLIALFYVTAREARRALPLDVFMGTTMSIAALVALPVALTAGVPLSGYSTQTTLFLAAIVLVTTLGGHGLMNLAARDVSLFALNLVIVLEPVISIALGAVMFDAQITQLQCVGGALLASAVVIGLVGSEPAPPDSAPAALQPPDPLGDLDPHR
jgi:drug/metabolite transporter (DMT)-like permease